MGTLSSDLMTSLPWMYELAFLVELSWSMSHLLRVERSEQPFIYVEGTCIRRECSQQTRREASEEPPITRNQLDLAEGVDEFRSGLGGRRRHHATVNHKMVLQLLQHAGTHFFMLSAGIAMNQKANEDKPPERKLAVPVLI